MHIGCRADDEELAEARTVLGRVVTTREATEVGMARTAADAQAVTGRGYWLHVDVDVLDPMFMPAVDSPDSGGLHPDQLTALLLALAPGAIGAAVTVFDPDLDPDGRFAALLTEIVVSGLGELGSDGAP